MAAEKDPQQIRRYLELFSPSEEELQMMILHMQKEGFAEAVPQLMVKHHEKFSGKRRTYSL